MKKVLQKTLFRLKALLLLAVMFVVGSSAGWAQEWVTVYENAINSADLFNSLYVYDVNGSSAEQGTWKYYEGQARYMYNGSLPGDDYLVLPAQALNAGLNYRISFDENTPMASQWGSESFEVVYGSASSDNPYSNIYNNKILVNTTYDNTSYSTISQEFSVSESGSYYIAIHSTSPKDRGYIYIKNIKLEVIGQAGGSDDSELSTLNFDSWNLSYSGGSNKPASSAHFNNGEVFSNADGVTMTLNNIPATQSWPTECFYSNPSGSTMALYLCNGEGFTIAAPSGYNLSKIVVNRAGTTYSMTSLIIDGVQNNDGTKGTWTGEAKSVEFSTISGDATKRILVSNIQVTLMPIVDEGEVTYTIDLVDAPDGAYVILDDQRFESSDTYIVEKNLGKNDLEAFEPEGYYAEVEYTRDSHTYTVTYHAYNYYDVTVTGTEDPAAGVVYNNQTYGNGARIETKDELTASSVTAAEVAGYNVELTFANGEFRVAYTEKPVQGVPWSVNVASIFNECTVVDANIDGKTWTKNGEEIYYHYHSSNYANDYIILPAIRLEAGKTYTVGVECHQDFTYTEKLEVLYGTTNNVAGMTNTAMPVKNVTWNDYAEVTNDFSVAADGVYYFAIHAVSNPDLLNLYVKTFSIKEPEPRQCVMDVASTFFSTGNVEQISSGLTFVADVNTEGEHSGYNGSSNEVPAGVILEDGNGTSYTISSMLWWDKSSQVAINLASAITAPGHYTLTIPEGVIPCVGNKANKEIVFEWTIAEPTTYTVTFADGAPAGASVTIGGNTYTESTTFQSRNNLDENSANVGNVEGYEGSVAYDSENKEFTITYTALPTYDYYVTIYPTEDTDLKIRIDGKEYGDSGMDFYTFYKELTEGDIVLPEYPGYYPNPSIEINNTYYTITVEYTPLPNLAIGSSASDSEGNYWTSFSLGMPVSFPAGVTPCIVTDAENGKLTLEEFPRVSNEVTTKYDFENNGVEEIFGNLYCEGDNHDVTMSCSGLSVYQSIGGKGYLKNEGTLNISCLTTPITKVIVKPWGWGTGANISLNGADPVAVADGDDTYTFEVNSYTCTLDITNYNGGVYLLWIEVVTSSGETIPVIPANTGILVKSAAPVAKILYAIHEDGEVNTDVSANILSASGETGFRVKNDADNLYYKLTLNAASEAGTAGFYWDKNSDEGHSINVPAHKAYLKLDAATASNFRYLIGGEEEGTLTAIDGVVETEDVANIYDLQGKRVVAPKAGVYVKNGKKFIVK